jgi:hypothetical protein
MPPWRTNDRGIRSTLVPVSHDARGTMVPNRPGFHEPLVPWFQESIGCKDGMSLATKFSEEAWIARHIDR